MDAGNGCVGKQLFGKFLLSGRGSVAIEVMNLAPYFDGRSNFVFLLFLLPFATGSGLVRLRPARLRWRLSGSLSRLPVSPAMMGLPGCFVGIAPRSIRYIRRGEVFHAEASPAEVEFGHPMTKARPR